MADRKCGARSFSLSRPAFLNAWATAVGKKEAEGPLGDCFDEASQDTRFGEDSWEKAERKMQETVMDLLLKKAGSPQIDLVFSGDLLNQCITSSFALRNRQIPWLGLYGACSTMAESLILASMAVSGGFADRAVAMTSSHFAASERQYRFPLGYGGQRTPTAQWTVTGSGGVLVSASGSGPRVMGATFGTVVDLGITDSNNMGAAMAPAAVETLKQHFEDFHCSPEDYDLIVTGDLGAVGRQIVEDQFSRMGVSLANRYQDCGEMIFDRKRQDVHAGGSGCGCGASVLCGCLLDRMQQGSLGKLLFCGTGALLSPVSVQQGESIPGVCHAAAIWAGKE